MKIYGQGRLENYLGLQVIKKIVILSQVHRTTAFCGTLQKLEIGKLRIS